MYRCATVSQGELERLRTIEHVVRKGRVKHVGANRIVLDDGEILTDNAQLHVDCTAAGLRVSPARPIFDSDRITLQQVRICQPTFNAALVAHVESSRADDVEKNRLCPPNPYPSAANDWIWANAISGRAQGTWMGERDLMEWMEQSRLNVARGIGDHMADPAMQSALTRFAANAEPALAKLEKLQVR